MIKTRFDTTTLPEVGFPGGLDCKESACQCRRPSFNPWIGKIPRRREWQPTPIFLSGEFHGHRSLAGYSPWGHKESDTTELLTHTHIHTHTCVYARACVCTHTFMILFNTANLSSTEDAPIYVFTENV